MPIAGPLAAHLCRLSTPQQEDEQAGDVALRVIATQPATAGMYRLDQMIAAMARHTLWLTDAYFIGVAPYVQALSAAARDGVDVRLLVPGTSDIPHRREHVPLRLPPAAKSGHSCVRMERLDVARQDGGGGWPMGARGLVQPQHRQLVEQSRDRCRRRRRRLRHAARRRNTRRICRTPPRSCWRHADTDVASAYAAAKRVDQQHTTSRWQFQPRGSRRPTHRQFGGCRTDGTARTGRHRKRHAGGYGCVARRAGCRGDRVAGRYRLACSD